MISRNQLQTEISKFSEEPQNLNQIANIRSIPGILILSNDLRILHVNQKAWELLRQIDNEQSLVGSPEVLLPEVADICAELQSITETHSESVCQEREVIRLASRANQKILLRGFRFRTPRRRPMSLILILIETVARRKMVTDKVRQLFHLTEREVTVIKYIAKGATNKEIGAELKIAEQTVKVHIRHVMVKTNTTTRTGILTRVLHFQNPLEPRFPISSDSYEVNYS